MPQVSRGCVQVKAEGHFSLKVVMLEIALTHLFVSTTFKKLQVYFCFSFFHAKNQQPNNFVI